MRHFVRHRLSRPLLLAGPSRASGISRRQARLLLALIVVALLVMLAMPTPAIDPTSIVIRDATLVERLRHDGHFYAIAADTLRSGGEALRPALAFPMPGVPVMVAALPSIVSIALMMAVAIVVAMAWQARLAPLCRGVTGRIVLFFLLIAGLVPAGHDDLANLIVVPEAWAGLLIALSLVRRRPGCWIEAAGFGLAAALMHGMAALYIIAMTALAWRDGERRESAGWIAALALLVMILGFHLHGVAGVLRPFDPATEATGWAGWQAGPFTIAAVTGAGRLPASLAAALVLLAGIGWTAWRDPLAIRAGVTLLAFAMLLASGVPAMGGLLVAPIALVGLVFIPDLLRDLIAAALDSRRITVTRSIR